MSYYIDIGGILVCDWYVYMYWNSTVYSIVIVQYVVICGYLWWIFPLVGVFGWYMEWIVGGGIGWIGVI